jgi:hypothetical protein
MSASKSRVEFFMRKLKWLDALSVALGKDHFTAHVAMIIGYHMNSYGRDVCRPGVDR